MFHSTKNFVSGANTCTICNLTFETKKEFFKHKISEHLRIARVEYEEDFDFEVGAKDSSECNTTTINKDITNITTKDITNNNTNNKDKPKTITENKPDTIAKALTKDDNKVISKANVYTKSKFECKECHEVFRNNLALTSHSCSYNGNYLEDTEDSDIKSSQKLKVF